MTAPKVGDRVTSSYGNGVVVLVLRWTEPRARGQVREVAECLVVYDDGARALVPASALTVLPERIRERSGSGDVAGIIATLRERESGERVSVHVPGTLREAVTALVACLRTANREGAEWRVVTLSTPQTIYRDLLASRLLLDGPAEGMTLTPEAAILSYGGGGDLLDEQPPRRVVAPTARGRARGRRKGAQ